MGQVQIYSSSTDMVTIVVKGIELCLLGSSHTISLQSHVYYYNYIHVKSCKWQRSNGKNNIKKIVKVSPCCVTMRVFKVNQDTNDLHMGEL